MRYKKKARNSGLFFNFTLFFVTAIFFIFILKKYCCCFSTENHSTEKKYIWVLRDKIKRSLILVITCVWMWISCLTGYDIHLTTHTSDPSGEVIIKALSPLFQKRP